jgi:hypothetical protein
VFTIQGLTGIKKKLADGCIRVQMDGADTNPYDDDIPSFAATDLPSPLTLEELSYAQLDDSTCVTIREEVRKGNPRLYRIKKEGCNLVCRVSNDPDHKNMFVHIVL